MAEDESLPKIDVLLRGYSLDTDVGLAGFCMVTLVEGVDDAGQRRRLLVDPAHVGRRTVLWDALAKRGLGPQDIDAVLLTHSHWDHIQNIDVFDHATVLIHPAERIYSMNPHRNDWATPAWTGVIIERQPIVEVVGGDSLLRGVQVIDLPGHTPGSVGLAVEGRAGLSVIAGDALHHARFALLGENPLIFWDAAMARESIRNVVEMADVIYPGHDRIFRLTKQREIEYLEPFEMTIRNVAASIDELRFEVTTPKQWVMPDIEQQLAAREGFEKAAAARRNRRLGAPEDDHFVHWWEVEEPVARGHQHH